MLRPLSSLPLPTTHQVMPSEMSAAAAGVGSPAVGTISIPRANVTARTRAKATVAVLSAARARAVTSVATVLQTNAKVSGYKSWCQCQ